MNNFGVIEVASERRTFAPGWAYVPDVPAGIGIGGAAGGGGGIHSGGFGAGVPEGAGGSAAAATATATKGGRKRALRHQAGSALSSFSDLTARQEAKMRKELELLDRDNGPVATGGGSARDAGIAIPAKAVKAANRHTANVRRILTSQKTFANYLDDFHALHESGAGASHDTDASSTSAAATAAALSNAKGGGHAHSPHRDDTPATLSSGGKAAGARVSKAKAAAAASSSAAASPAPGKRLTKKEIRQQNAAAAAAASRAARAARADRSTRSARATASHKGVASEAAPEAASAEDTPMADAPPPSTQDHPVKQEEEGAATVDAAVTTTETEAQDGAADTEAAASPPPPPPPPPPPLPPFHVSSILTPYTGPRQAPHPLDNDPLLVSYVPPVPEDDELRALLAVPPLTYTEARATWSAGPDGILTKRYPPRVFCEICGYWGRVKCTKCGTPVCALDCLETHREDCITRYGL